MQPHWFTFKEFKAGDSLKIPRSSPWSPCPTHPLLSVRCVWSDLSGTQMSAKASEAGTLTSISALALLPDMDSKQYTVHSPVSRSVRQ